MSPTGRGSGKASSRREAHDQTVPPCPCAGLIRLRVPDGEASGPVRFGRDVVDVGRGRPARIRIISQVKRTDSFFRFSHCISVSYGIPTDVDMLNTNMLQLNRIEPENEMMKSMKQIMRRLVSVGGADGFLQQNLSTFGYLCVCLSAIFSAIS